MEQPDLFQPRNTEEDDISKPVDSAETPFLEVEECIKFLLSEITRAELPDKVAILNSVRSALHKVSPFADEPVDFVRWVQSENVYANDYNPNSVAPPEMELLRLSIEADGYTQPIVSMADESGNSEVIDGFHRHRVGKECADIQDRVKGYLPVVEIRESQTDRNNRIASTIRHNRARGKHNVDSMSDIVVELKRRNWSNQRIQKELGMDEDEVLRLCQITGLQELFSDQQFSAAWDVADNITEDDFQGLSDEIEEVAQAAEGTRVVNSDDPDRVFHTFDQWECYKAGFYNTTVEGMDRKEAEAAYGDFFKKSPEFQKALSGVLSEWKNSCEHYLTNKAMNRIAWLGQASACYAKGLPCKYRSGFSLLTEEEQEKANQTALEALNQWLNDRGSDSITMEEAVSGERQSNIY